jgi:hypothetical protein
MFLILHSQHIISSFKVQLVIIFHFYVIARGHEGGVWLLKLCDCPYIIDIIDIYYQVVTMLVTHNGKLWYSSVVYVFPCPFCSRNIDDKIA